MDIAYSMNRVPIRLTEERWFHIVENHDEMAGYYEQALEAIEEPDYILSGYAGALIAVRRVAERRYLKVVYRENSPLDGFIITGYFARRIDRRQILWQRQA